MAGTELEIIIKTVADLVNDALMVVDSQGNVLSSNGSFERLSGYMSSEIQGKSLEILHHDSKPHDLLQNDDKSTPWTGLLRHKKGTTFRATVKRKMLQKADGQVVGVLLTIYPSSPQPKMACTSASRFTLPPQVSHFHGIVGNSELMREMYEMIKNAATSHAPVIIYGESGTGKELVSRAIHSLGPRKAKPYIKVNCAALTESLLESELFGHVKGAYTGAYKDRVGRFEKAHEGDIFLDEIGDLPLSTQTKLLRVLEEKVIERVGSSSPIKTNVRFISATNQDLFQLVEQGGYRKDFYFRINVIPIFIPPLRQRVDDIPLLAHWFVEEIVRHNANHIRAISDNAIEVLKKHHWPGNVRELRGVFEYAAVTCKEDIIQPHHLPTTIFKNHGGSSIQSRRNLLNMQEIEKRELLEVLAKTDGNQSKAAELLGVSRVTVWNRMKRYGIDAKKQIEIRHRN